jgi:hypothetical protein
MIGNGLRKTAELISFINGLTLFPCVFLYAILTAEYKLGFVDLMKTYKVSFYGTNDTTVIALNVLASIGFACHSLTNYNLCYNVEKPGEKNKLK